jgi:negative regulator of sigma-B (phosphoserine phosphatase)
VNQDLVIEHQSHPKLGETANGDAVVVRYFRNGALVALIDALGHGPHAEFVARRAVSYLNGRDYSVVDAGTEAAMHGLHSALRGTRGAAAMICLIRDGALHGCSVGNVEIRCVGTALPAMLSPGIVGVRMQALRSFSGMLPPNARYFIFSDGVSRNAPFHALAELSARQACETLTTKYRHDHDDASAVVLARKEPNRFQIKRESQ